MDFAHAGKTGIDPIQRTKLWLLIVREKKNWSNAKVHCENSGGKLFSDRDGSVAQLQFIVGKFGVHRESADSTQWVTIDEKLVPDNKILWGSRAGNQEPDLGDALCIVSWAVTSGLQYLHDDIGLPEYSFLCDLKREALY